MNRIHSIPSVLNMKKIKQMNLRWTCIMWFFLYFNNLQLTASLCSIAGVDIPDIVRCPDRGLLRLGAHGNVTNVLCMCKFNCAPVNITCNKKNNWVLIDSKCHTRRSSGNFTYQHGPLVIHVTKETHTFSCVAGHRLNGAGSLQCINSALSGQIPICEKIDRSSSHSTTRNSSSPTWSSLPIPIDVFIFILCVSAGILSTVICTELVSDFRRTRRNNPTTSSNDSGQQGSAIPSKLSMRPLPELAVSTIDYDTEYCYADNSLTNEYVNNNNIGRTKRLKPLLKPQVPAILAADHGNYVEIPSGEHTRNEGVESIKNISDFNVSLGDLAESDWEVNASYESSGPNNEYCYVVPGNVGVAWQRA